MHGAAAEMPRSRQGWPRPRRSRRLPPAAAVRREAGAPSGGRLLLPGCAACPALPSPAQRPLTFAARRAAAAAPRALPLGGLLLVPGQLDVEAVLLQVALYVVDGEACRERESGQAGLGRVLAQGTGWQYGRQAGAPTGGQAGRLLRRVKRGQGTGWQHAGRAGRREDGDGPARHAGRHNGKAGPRPESGRGARGTAPAPARSSSGAALPPLHGACAQLHPRASPSTPISFRMPLGVALSGPPSSFTAPTKRPCRSGVQRSRDFWD